MSPVSVVAAPQATALAPAIGASPTPSGDTLVEASHLLDIAETAVSNNSIPCMAAAGFEMEQRTVAPIGRSLPYGLPTWADPANGYHIPSNGPIPKEPTIRTDGPFLSALYGAEPSPVLTLDLPSGSGGSVTLFGGCYGKARAALSGSAEEFGQFLASFLILQDLLNGVLSRVQASETFIALNKSWSDCMANAGYDLASPADASNFAFPGEGLSQQEVLLATADIGCKVETSYESQANSLTDAQLQKAVEDQPEIWRQWQEESAKMTAALNP